MTRDRLNITEAFVEFVSRVFRAADYPFLHLALKRYEAGRQKRGTLHLHLLRRPPCVLGVDRFATIDSHSRFRCSCSRAEMSDTFWIIISLVNTRFHLLRKRLTNLWLPCLFMLADRTFQLAGPGSRRTFPIIGIFKIRYFKCLNMPRRRFGKGEILVRLSETRLQIRSHWLVGNLRNAAPRQRHHTRGIVEIPFYPAW
jgi:hypothetical protein